MADEVDVPAAALQAGRAECGERSLPEPKERAGGKRSVL